MFRFHQKRRGFTLIEVLLVVAIIGILAAIVILAINPPRNIASANNAQRQSNVNTILSAIHQYAIDNRGSIPTTISGASVEICKTFANCAGLVDLTALTDQERYIITIPTDPTNATTNGTGYFVYKDTYNRVTVTAPYAENGASISVSQ